MVGRPYFSSSPNLVYGRNGFDGIGSTKRAWGRVLVVVGSERVWLSKKEARLFEEALARAAEGNQE